MEFHFTLEFKISNQLILLFAHFRFYDIKYMVSQFIRKDLFMENYHVNRSCGRGDGAPLPVHPEKDLPHRLQGGALGEIPFLPLQAAQAEGDNTESTQP